jgi:hypothetical protein
LAHSFEALFAKELCVLLTSLEIFSSGYGNDIVYVFAWKASEDIVHNMEKSLNEGISLVHQVLECSVTLANPMRLNNAHYCLLIYVLQSLIYDKSCYISS